MYFAQVTTVTKCDITGQVPQDIASHLIGKTQIKRLIRLRFNEYGADWIFTDKVSGDSFDERLDRVFVS